ncbi:MAG: LysM peptidoglycan-binding domain-containing protein [Deltaproteobacteria bacterium]|jgi:hypothetical protein|nr:LysM peptidoglycan-binding domain-containing protein [Deltaproteobacteria bacterium]MBW2531580.1 LysM peptidoglycan-binding domain-containing protein [Deltaproteobacteria bacterium]
MVQTHISRLAPAWLARATGALLTLTPALATAQQGGGDAPADASVSASTPGGGNVTVVTLPPAASQSSTSTASEAPSVNAHLPSSSRASSDISSAGDGFDFGGSGSGGSTVRGNAKGSYVVSGQYVPDLHTAKRGDTLWDISNRYFGNPYQWPRVWSYNRQIQNPHWIYPGDHIRLRGNYGVSRSHLGHVRPSPTVRQNTVFVRNLGWVEDGKDPSWGEIVGSPDDQMILSHDDIVYIQLEDEYHVSVGQQLAVIEPLDVDNLAGAELIYIRGTVQVNRYNPKTHMVRARIVESIRPIERGVLVGPIDRRIDEVTAKRNAKDLHAQVIASLDPFVFYGQNQVVFIDRGSKDGVEVGNRFFAVSRGDEWRRGLKNAGRLADKRAITEDDRQARVEDTPDHGDDDRYPTETYGELIVLRVREETAVCLVTASTHELPRGADLVAHQGY